MPFLVLFIILPLTELATILWVHELLAAYWGGAMATFLAIASVIATGIGGAALAKSQGLLVIHDIQEATSRGNMPGTALVDGVLVLLGGVLLLTPGYITDIVGFSCLFPLSRMAWRTRLLSWFQGQLQKGNVVFSGFSFGGDYGGRYQRYGSRIVDISGPDDAKRL